MDQDDDPALAETQSPALGARPVADPRARAVARAKIANALFATEQRVKLGRYHLLERVGQGGMGVVWGAYDPELERRVAIKLVHAASGASRERILLEGQALAKLSHPNVVAVYDVGVVDDEVYLVMEWIRGHHLRVHCAKPRSVREIVALYRAAGEGLYAAHRAGLVHRDFKPENVMVGDDGRVRVLDFGLAVDRGEGEDHAVAGTPRYMAPEQQRGEPITDAADQYAFGVALREALVARYADRGEAPLPGWLAAVVERAAAATPAERFPSMEALLRVLARDPASVWRRRALVGGAVAATAVAFAIGSLRADDNAPEPCAGGRDEIARVWGPDARARVAAHARTLGPYALAEVQRLESALAEYANRWVSAHRSACLAHQRGEVTTRIYERGLTCIAGARTAFATVIDVLGRSTVDGFPHAVTAARSLPDMERCMIDATDSAVEPPPRELAPLMSALSADATGVRYLALASDPRAISAAAPVAAAAERIGYQPLVARAQLALGAALANDDSRIGDAALAFSASATAALAASDDVLFVEAYAREIYTAGRMSPDDRPVAVRDFANGIPLAEVIAKRTTRAGAFARTLFYNNVGTSRLAAGDPAGARHWFRKARDELRAGARGVELWVALGNLAMVVESSTEREQLFAEERAALERELGPTHFFALLSRLRAAGYAVDAAAAARALDEICAAYQTWYPHQVERIAKCNYELGYLRDELGDRDAARRAYEAVATTSFRQEARLARVYLASSPTELERAALELIADGRSSEAWFLRFPYAVDAALLAARARIAQNKHAAAIDVLREALEDLGDKRLNQTSVRYQRRLARVRAELAMLLATRDRARAVALATASLAWSRAAGGYQERVHTLESITAGSR